MTMGFIKWLGTNQYLFNMMDFKRVSDLRTGDKFMDFLDVRFGETLSELMMRYHLTMEDLKESELIITDYGVTVCQGKKKYGLMM